MTPFPAGFTLGISLIIVIGAQNAFVLRQGLRRAHVFWICLVCAVSDAVLIVVGVGGFDWMVARVSWLEVGARVGGAAFLIGYGARSFWSAWAKSSGLTAADSGAGSRAAAVSTCLALTWLNPHVYLDTVVLLGSVSTQYVGGKLAFASGAVLASFTFFFALGYGARMLSPFFSRPVSWKILDALIGALLWYLAYGIIVGTV